MFFSEKYPEIIASIEEKLKTQVEERGLDFETVRKDQRSVFTHGKALRKDGFPE